MRKRVAFLGALLVISMGLLWSMRDQIPTQRTPALAGAPTHLDVAYGSHERNRLDVYTPEGAGPHPTIIWFHPGGWVVGDKAESMPIWDWTERGYAIVAVNYRYAKAPHTVADSVDDAFAAVRHVLDNHAEWGLDPLRTGVLGTSAGGHLAAMIAHEGLPVQAVATSGAPTDFGPLLQPDVEFFDGNRGADVVTAVRGLLGCAESVETCESLATQVSPAQLSPGSVDLLIVHGERDRVVDVDQARRLADHLTAAGEPPLLVLVADAGHDWLVTEGGIAEFFDERLLS